MELFALDVARDDEEGIDIRAGTVYAQPVRSERKDLAAPVVRGCQSLRGVPSKGGGGEGTVRFACFGFRQAVVQAGLVDELLDEFVEPGEDDLAVSALLWPFVDAAVLELLDQGLADLEVPRARGRDRDGRGDAEVGGHSRRCCCCCGCCCCPRVWLEVE